MSRLKGWVILTRKLVGDFARKLTDETLLDLPFTSDRKQVIELIGAPSKSGGKTSDPILGEYGAWDRFTRLGYTIHIEYRVDTDSISKITLIRADVVP